MFVLCMGFEFASTRNLFDDRLNDSVFHVSRWLKLTPREDPNSLFQKNRTSELQKDLKDTGTQNVFLTCQEDSFIMPFLIQCFDCF